MCLKLSACPFYVSGRIPPVTQGLPPRYTHGPPSGEVTAVLGRFLGATAGHPASVITTGRDLAAQQSSPLPEPTTSEWNENLTRHAGITALQDRSPTW